ncbi:DUF2147 domain-containing protein [Sorlinia euscelidii]
MMPRLASRAAVLLVAFFSFHAVAKPAHLNRAAQGDVTGIWMAQTQDGVFHIFHCGAEICGRLVGMDYEGPVPHDVLGRSQCDLTMLTGFTPRGDGQWQGKIFDPEGGKVYDAIIWSPNPNILKLRGYLLGIPLLGRTQIWTRYTGHIGPACKMTR